MEWRNRIIGYDTKPASQFTPNPSNWRVHPSVQREALRGLLGDVGWVGAVLENKQTGNLIDGHARIEEALNQDSNTLIPYLLVDLSPDEEKLVLASFDPISALATSDKDKLESLLKEVSASSEAVDSLLSEIAKKNGVLLDSESKDAEPQIDKAAELQQKWGTETGQLWVIGSHLLLCGNPVAMGDISRLITDSVDVCLTDPPYNVGLDYGKDADDKRDEAEFWQWQQTWFDLAVSVSSRQVVTPGCVNLERWIAAFAPSHVCVWDKGEGANTYGRVTRHWAWEPVMCHGKFERQRHTDVFRYSALGENPGHPCPKPLTLWSDLLDTLCGGSTVYDPFLGSGSTMVSAENLKKQCYAMEISPAYVAVCLERMATAFPHLKIERVQD